MDISAPCLREIHSLYPGVSERFAHQILTSTLNQAAVLKINSLEKVIALLHQKRAIVGSLPYEIRQIIDRLPNDRASKVVKFLFTNQKNGVETKFFLKWDSLKAILLKRDEAFQKEVLSKFQIIFTQIAHYFQKPSSSRDSSQEKIAEMFLGNMIALIPFFEPKGGSRFEIPQKVNGVWRSVRYEIEKIALTHPIGGSCLYASGFVPKWDSKAPALISFPGTCHPTVSGARYTFWTDFSPFSEVGRTMWVAYGRKSVKGWMEKHNSHRFNLFGQSLGGSTALNALADFPEKIGSVYGYGSPSLRSRHSEQYEKKLSSIPVNKRPQVFLLNQENDIVPWIRDAYPKDFHVYNVSTKDSFRDPRPHVLAFTGGPEKVCMTEFIETAGMRRKRILINVFYHIVSLFAFVFLSLFLALRMACSLIMRGVSICKSERSSDRGLEVCA